MKTPKPREWTDPKSGRTYWRVRWNDANGKEVVRVFGQLDEANQQVATIVKEREKHGRAAAVNSDEVGALASWREFVAAENTAGRDVPPLREVMRTAIERLKERSTTPGLQELSNRFQDAKEREKVSPRHLAALKNRLGRFVSYFAEDEPSGSITTEGVERVMASMRSGGMAPQTVKGIRAAAHGLFQWALDRDLVTSNPITRAKAPKVRQGEVGTITPSQLLGLLKTAMKLEPQSVPALAVWAFCGVRRAELCRIRYEDLDLKRKELRVSAQAAKTGVARFVPMPESLLAWLDAAKAAGVAPLGKLVPGQDEMISEGQLNRWLRDIRPAAGIQEWPNNALRHSFASHAAAKFEDFSKVAAWLGHARDPRLLVTRYRHAVAKDAGEKWFGVVPQSSKAKTPTSKGAKKAKSATA